LLQAADFGTVTPFFTEPLAIGYREVAVATPPPNSYGAMLLGQLALLGREPAAGDVIERLVQWITANRRALEALAGRIADPGCVARPDIAGLVRDPARSSLGHGDTRGGTATVSVADGAGNGATIILSVFRGFGAGVLDPATGVLLNNRMRGFSLDPRHPNVVAPGKRPAHTLAPALVTRDRVLRCLVASPGGVGQTVTLTQVIANLVDRGMSVDDAVAAPRWSREADGDPIVEAGIGAGVVEALAARGIAAKIGAARAVYFGSVELIARAPDGTLSSAPDPRRDGAAVAL
jgi:gamma-glutamyltranspeptidase/glutathione hydrolase